MLIDSEWRDIKVCNVCFGYILVEWFEKMWELFCIFKCCKDFKFVNIFLRKVLLFNVRWLELMFKIWSKYKLLNVDVGKNLILLWDRFKCWRLVGRDFGIGLYFNLLKFRFIVCIIGVNIGEMCIFKWE